MDKDIKIILQKENITGRDIAILLGKNYQKVKFWWQTTFPPKQLKRLKKILYRRTLKRDQMPHGIT